ncbi:MAG: hypothetical protein HRT63_00050 [Erythrobacter sp.]|nr:hypothetical protein [Erythrobacter sp.]
MIEIPPMLIQTGGSLLAIFALFLLARWLKLGGKPVLADHAAVQHAANEVEDGFATQRSAIARAGDAALAVDAAGRIMVIKRHGNHFSGRVLTPAAKVREEVDAIVVDCGEARFGPVRMSLDETGYWVDAINRL